MASGLELEQTPRNEQVTLANCDVEPIHVPGAIQPHGALLAFDRLGRLSYASANASGMLGTVPAFGERLRATDLGACQPCHDLIREMLETAPVADDPAPHSALVQVAGQDFDLVVHAFGGYTVCEFERCAQDAEDRMAFAQKAYRSMDRLKRQRSVEQLLDEAVLEIRAMTGFDRVMAYRFRHDDSGDVVAEARRDDLEPYLGRRYPAGDIPAQARRLYVLNTLRLIADAGYRPVPVAAAEPALPPLDLSHSVLRSVSPIHIEYLRNMGVAASMSVSIVVAGRLWGMIACHHLAPLQVPYATRLACDVVAQLMASTVQSLDAKSREAAVARAALQRTELITLISAGTGIHDALTAEAPALATSLGADVLVLAEAGRLHVQGDVDERWVRALLADMTQQARGLVHLTTAAELPPGPDGGPPPYCGVLAMGYDRAGGGWVVALRREQVQTIRWGGKPEKPIAHGPLGPRLTPRGSFAEWRETVRGTAVPWDAVTQEIARQLLDALRRAHADRVMSMDRARSQLWAMLGHDLRNPLQSISMAAQVIGRRGSTDRLNTVLRNSTDRMSRLISEVLDISRLQSGIGLGVSLQQVDLVPLVEQLVEEIVVAHPDTVIERHMPPSLVAEMDPVRISQVIVNLLSNARHHGEGGPIALEAGVQGGRVVLKVRNRSAPIPPDIAAHLFDPFKRQSVGNERNPMGMGLGLYIAEQIMRAHGGTLHYEAKDGEVIFECGFPEAQAPG